MISLFAYFGMPGPLELIVIALVVLLLFGKRLPSVMGSLGKSIVEFKKGVKGVEEEIERAVEDSSSSEAPKSNDEAPKSTSDEEKSEDSAEKQSS